MHLGDSWGLGGGLQRPEFQEKEGPPCQGKEGTQPVVLRSGAGELDPGRRLRCGAGRRRKPACCRGGAMQGAGWRPHESQWSSGTSKSHFPKCHDTQLTVQCWLCGRALWVWGHGLRAGSPMWPTTGCSRSPACLGGQRQSFNQRFAQLRPRSCPGPPSRGLCRAVLGGASGDWKGEGGFPKATPLLLQAGCWVPAPFSALLSPPPHHHHRRLLSQTQREGES